jgi:hypothetical protein
VSHPAHFIGLFGGEVREKIVPMNGNQLIQQVPFKEAIAHQMNGGRYVNDPTLRLMFLRADHFNPAEAAARFAKFHERIRQYFGVGALGRPLTLADRSGVLKS